MIGATTVALIHARSLWRRRWHGLAVAWLVCLAGWGLVLYLPNEYEARARIYVDTDSMLRPLLRGIAADTTIVTQVDVMQRTLLSRPNLQKVSHLADLELAARTATDSEAVLNDLKQRVVLTGDGRNLFTLAYTSSSRETALKVVQALLSVFVENNLGNSRKDIASAQKFIDDQLHDYAEQLDQAEKRVADFKAKNVGFLPGENSYSAKLDTARLEYEKDKAELDDDKRKRDELAKQLEGVPKYTDSYLSTPGDLAFGAGPPIGGGAGDTASPDEGLRVAELEHKLNQLLENDTEQHPDVIRTRRLLDQAKAAAARAQAERAAQKPANMPDVDPHARRSTVPNPVYEQLQLQLVTLDSNIASVEARGTRAKAEVDRLDKLAKSVPEVGAELTKLTRDYDVTRKSYEELLNRRESAKIGSDMETQTQTVQFRIVDPPASPTLPVAPKRALLLSVVLVGGIMAGAAFAFLLTQIDDSVMTLRQLKEAVSIHVLGAVSRVTSATTTRRQRVGVVAYAAVCLALVMVYAGIMSLATILQLRA